MRGHIQVFGKIRMTAAILALVLLAIIGSIATVSAAIYLNVHGQALSGSSRLQATNLAVAATILERRISGSTLSWTPEGTLGPFQTWKIPQFDGTEIIDSVTRVTGEDASIYGYDPAGERFAIMTTSVANADQAGASETSLDAGSPAYGALLDHKTYVGEVTVNGIAYLAAFHPIENNMSGEVVGAIFVGTPVAEVEASPSALRLP